MRDVKKNPPEDSRCLSLLTNPLTQMIADKLKDLGIKVDPSTMLILRLKRSSSHWWVGDENRYQ